MINFFQNLFSSKEEVETTIMKTAELSEKKDVKEYTVSSSNYSPIQIVVGTGQSIGMQRDHNEDALFALNLMLSEGKKEIPFGLFIVADGMGGHSYGEIASGVVLKVFADHIMSKLFSKIISLKDEGGEDSLQEVMEEGVEVAQEVVVKEVPGGGTTLTAALIIGSQVTFAHVGDSRAYFISPDGAEVKVITHDHSLVQRLVDLGQITEEEAEVHPQRNVLYRALGQPESFKPDIRTHPLPSPGYILICSDGLWGQISEDELTRLVVTAPNPSAACHDLIKAANDAGGPDNITAILVQIY